MNINADTHWIKMVKARSFVLIRYDNNTIIAEGMFGEQKFNSLEEAKEKFRKHGYTEVLVY